MDYKHLRAWTTLCEADTGCDWKIEWQLAHARAVGAPDNVVMFDQHGPDGWLTLDDINNPPMVERFHVELAKLESA